MLNRRDILLGAAAATLLPQAARAQSEYIIPEHHMPRIVRINDGVPPGEIHIDPNNFFLYWTLEDSRAIRYVVGVGRPGLYESGVFSIGAKKEWPAWTPTDEMIERNPAAYKQWEDGMPGGPTNPLGARALYLFAPGIGDTFLRIHGTPEPWTIGRAVSNGCARLTNSHISHLYDLVPIGAKAVLHPQIGGVTTS